MYYTSKDKIYLIAYNELVNSKEGYRGATMQWASIIEHPNGLNFAILKHPKYTAKLTLIEALGADWFPDTDI
jgi:hypothetical protein